MRGIAHRNAGCAVPHPQGKLWMRFVWGWLRQGVLSASPLLFPFQQLQARGGWGWPLGGEVSSPAAAGLASFAGVLG